eukprot:GEMP01034822.1.p1 GENE.GEMP01034822.1~~GEMP01034822.1.p1  ORF type:complete len:520 (+),score=110.62 GEMP01034822.1:235-1560(+)
MLKSKGMNAECAAGTEVGSDQCQGSEVLLGKVDATADTKLADAHKVLGFPTVKLHFNGTWIDYDGGRTDQSIVSWVLKKTGQVAAKIETAGELSNFVKKHPMTCIYFGTDELAINVFTVASKDINDVMFAVASPSVLGTLADVTDGDVLAVARDRLKEGCIAMFYPHDAKFNILEPTSQIVIQSEVESFVRGHRLPIVVPFSGEVAEDLFNDPRPLLFLFRDSIRPEDQVIETKFREVAPELKSIVAMSVVGIIEPMEQRLMDFLAVEAGDAPTLRFIQEPLGSKIRYKFTGNEWTSDEIWKFVHDADAGRLGPHYKSQPIPTQQNDPVITIVGDSFTNLVLESPKDVVVQFYAPWCGHCKKMEPVMNQLGKKFKASPAVVIGKFDATINDAPGVEIIGFPMLKLWPATDKVNPIDYDGERDFQSIAAWIEAKTSSDKQEL